MKKTLPAIILAALAAASIPFTLAACGDDEGSATEGLSFTLSADGEYYVVSGAEEGTEGDIVIPETYNELPVTQIAQFAFSEQDITSVVVPASVTVIGTAAFNSCTALTSITFEGSLESIGQVAFANCGALAEVVLPNGLTAIQSSTFMGCSALTDITIPASVTAVGDRAFYGCNALTTVHYRGSRTAWLGIDIAANNDPLTSAEVVFNS